LFLDLKFLLELLSGNDKKIYMLLM
jgi:hypothetical protein